MVIACIALLFTWQSATTGPSILQAAQQAELPAPNRQSNEPPQGTASPTTAAAPSVEQAYVGTNQCFQCHRPQTNTWSETKHAQAFTHVPEKYSNDVACLRCHVTGFGKANGFVAGTEKDLLMVGCESCHGAGAKHVDAANRFILATPDEEAQIQKEMKESIVRIPNDSVCAACHITQAHGIHPEYGEPLPGPRPSTTAASGSLVQCDFMPLAGHAKGSSSARTRYSPGYSVKTCGSCHYDQYQHARAEKHIALSATLPPKYVNDQECQKCHAMLGAAATILANASTQASHVGAACESCHGPALEHVRFNVRYIHGPRLGPQLEQAARDSIRKGKPESSCIGCHVGESHKEHPAFEGGASDSK
jgi:hypothetical protein